MSSMFGAGEKFAEETPNPVTIIEYLGAGGQGEVYKVDRAGEVYAMKWYFEHTGTRQQKEMIESLVRQGTPSDAFLWPTELVTHKNRASFGYLMPLRPERFKSFVDVVSGKVDPKFHVLMTVGLNLVKAFYELHSKGLCYRDISFGNGFFDLSNGDVLICDNDNVTRNNATVDTVLGTPDFMAPEIVNRKARPSRETDYFSLSVLLFYLFHIQHPLLGKKVLAIRSWDLPAREKLFGKEPVFIFDPNDRSNEAIDDPAVDRIGEAGRNAIPYWTKVYPKILKDAFIRSFTDGIRNPEKRLLGSEWSDVLLMARSSIFSCPACEVENFYDPETGERTCWSCNTKIAPKFFLVAEKMKIPLSPETRILECQLGTNGYSSDSAVLGTVVKHPQRSDVWGLRNDTEKNWAATPEGREMVEIPVGKSVPLAKGTKINIGSYSCRIDVR